MNRPSIQQRIGEVRARADLAEVVRRRVPKLREAGREWSACCPFHDEATPSFTVVPEKGFYHCFGCGAHGDAIDFVMKHEGCEFGEALERVEGECGIRDGGGVDPAPTRPAADRRQSNRSADTSWVDSTEAGQTVWTEAGTARGTLVETYLAARGIDHRASGVMTVIRFHPRCPVKLWRRWESPADVRDTCPAMLLPIFRVEGLPGSRTLVQQGVEVVFLEADGRSKKRFAVCRDRSGRERRPPSRKIWGDLQGGGVPIPPLAWSDAFQAGNWIDAMPERPLVVGEGFESTLSLLARTPSPRGGFATLSLDNMQGACVEERIGREWAMPLHNLRPDPRRAVFTVADAGAVTIGIDADMKGLKGRRVQERPRGPLVKRDLTGAERSTICGTLAAAQWRRAGARTVDVVRPPAGADFNDLDAPAGWERAA